MAFRIPQLTYGITPPKATYAPERRQRVAAAQVERIRRLPIDALVLYDLQDESTRTSEARPFPFLKTVPPLTYAYEDLAELTTPKIIYRSVAGQDADALTTFMHRVHDRGDASVLVGAPSRHQAIQMSLRDAYDLRRTKVPDLALGGVLIAERHGAKGQEHLRAIRKVDQGCGFFISQAVFSVQASKDLISDLFYHCQSIGTAVPPVLVTLSPCGSVKTLAFMRWLGIQVPRWIENDLVHAQDILARSVTLCVQAFEELDDFARGKGIRLGANVESVSLAKAEIDASVEMVHRLASILKR